MITTKLPNGGILCESNNGDRFYYLNGFLHREDGPAEEYFHGDKIWHVHGKIHREDGPAIEIVNGDKYWFINDKQIHCKTQKEFEQLMKLKAFW